MKTIRFTYFKLIQSMQLPIQLLLAILLLTGCNKNKKDNFESLATGHNAQSAEHHMADSRTMSLMAIHDSIMPLTEVIIKLEREVSTEIRKIDSLIAEKPTEQLRKKKMLASGLLSRLSQADAAMMGWMHQYSTDTITKSDAAEANVYLMDQRQKIQTVRALMKKSIADAQLFMEKK